jgi:cystathionine beta-lyase
VASASSGFSVMAASKAWNLPGLKCAVAIAGTDAVDDLKRMPAEVSHGPSHLGSIAHTAALRDGGPWLDAALAGLDANRRLLGRLLAEHLPAVTWTPPEASYLAWLDCTALRLPDPAGTAPAGENAAPAEPAAVFLARARVALGSGRSFGTGGAGHVRLNFATSTAILTDAMRLMGAVAA